MPCKSKRCLASQGETIILPAERSIVSEGAYPVMVEVPDSNEFQIWFRLIKASCYPVICLIPSTIPVVEVFTDWPYFWKSTKGFFVDFTNGCVFPWDGDSTEHESLKMKKGSDLLLDFSSKPLPRLSHINHGQFSEISFGKPLPSDDYSLYVIVDRCCKIELTLTSSAKRQKTSPSALLQQMWSATEFADAEVVCGSRSFPVHRAVLCKASPVFAATFRGSMKEATEARLEITDSTPEAVHAMLSYIYTDALGTGTAVEVLHLAHRFQLDDLVHDCCEQALASLTTTNASSIVQALRALRADPIVAPTWEAIVEKISSEKSLIRAVLEV